MLIKLKTCVLVAVLVGSLSYQSQGQQPFDTTTDPTQNYSDEDSEANQGLAAASLDWLSKQISSPTADEQRGQFQLFGNEKSKRSAIKTGATLILVISLFLLLAFVWRLRSPGRSRRNGLPGDILAVLGQTQLGQSQRLQLIRLGSKLLLVSTTQHGSQTLGEITDPEEVYRIESICSHGRWPSLSQSLREKAERQVQLKQQSETVLGSQQSVVQGGKTLLEA